LLETVDLECVRGDRPLFSHLSFALKAGELLHVTGVNGSGKTTLLRALCGLTHAQVGEIRWNGAAIRQLGDEYHAQLAYVGHTNGIQGDLTPAENLRVATSLSGCDIGADIPATLKRLGLSAYHRFPSKILSQGQKRRLALGRLLVERKPLWILDEPLSGLDVDSVSLMTTILMEHLAQDGLIVITSHQEISVKSKTVLQIRIN
jgi:heme exporter protein A